MITLLDLFDVLFKSNLRNLDLLEDWLLKGAQYKIALMPKKEFLPRKTATGAAPSASARDKCTFERYDYSSRVLRVLPDRNRTKTTRMDETFSPPDLD